MQFGFMTFARDLDAVASTVRLAEETGWDLFGFADSPALAHDAFISLAVAAQHSTRVWIGPIVTNPLTRHPLILSNLSESLERLAPGRVFLGIGTGNSVMAGVGVKPAKLDTLRDAVRLIRGLTSGETVPTLGVPLRVWGGGPKVPIMIAGSGPRTLRLAGAVADWAFVTVGTDPLVVRDALGWVREGAIGAGRDPSSVQCWVFLPGSIASDRSQARDEVKTAAIGVSTYILRGDSEAKRIPLDVREKFAELMRGYSYAEHLTPGRSANYELADRLGLAEYLIDHCTISGTPGDCQEAIGRLQQVGVERFCFSFTASPNLTRYVRLFADEVVPEFRDS